MTIDTSSLSHAYLDAQPIDIDWDEARGDDGDGLDIHLPEITRAVLEDYGHEPEAFDAASWLEDNLEAYIGADWWQKLTDHAERDEMGLADWLRDNWRYQLDAATGDTVGAAMQEAKEEHDEDALERAVEDFRGSNGYYEWEDGHQPVMNALWPCEPRYGMSDEDAATAIDRYAGATVLVTINNEQHHGLQGIAMTGGGMDLSWDLAAAYVCCGCIPPVRLLSDMPRYAGMRMDPMRAAILECMDLAADWMASRADSLRQCRAAMDRRLTK